jgi:hypothetical protein
MSTKRRFWALLGTTSVISLALAALPGASAGAAVDSPGWLEVYADNDVRVLAQGWPANPLDVTVTVNGNLVATDTTHPMSDGPPGSWGIDQWLPGVTLAPGDVVTVADTTDLYFDTLTIADVGIDDIDFASGAVSGHGTAGAQGQLCVYEPWARYRPAGDCPDFTVPDGGLWSVTSFGMLRPTVNMAFSNYDPQGNSTNAGGFYGPWFQVDYPWWVSGEAWTPDSVVQVVVSDPYGEYDPATNEAGEFGLEVAEPISPGATVTVSDGVTEKSLEVYTPSVDVDVDADTVSGDAPDGADVVAVVEDESLGEVARHEVSNGGFVAEFATPGGGDGDYEEETTVDVLPQSSGATRIYDGDFDYTETPWQATPLVLELSMSSTGTVNTVSGQALVTGTVWASYDTWVVLTGTLSQRVGRNKLARGWFEVEVQAGPDGNVWQVEVWPDSVPFGSGQAYLQVDTWASDTDAGASTEGYVQLKAQKRSRR